MAKCEIAGCGKAAVVNPVRAANLAENVMRAKCGTDLCKRHLSELNRASPAEFAEAVGVDPRLVGIVNRFGFRLIPIVTSFTTGKPVVEDDAFNPGDGGVDIVDCRRKAAEAIARLQADTSTGHRRGWNHERCLGVVVEIRQYCPRCGARGIEPGKKKLPCRTCSVQPAFGKRYARGSIDFHWFPVLKEGGL